MHKRARSSLYRISTQTWHEAAALRCRSAPRTKTVVEIQCAASESTLHIKVRSQTDLLTKCTDLHKRRLTELTREALKNFSSSYYFFPSNAQLRLPSSRSQDMFRELHLKKKRKKKFSLFTQIQWVSLMGNGRKQRL